MRIKVEHSTHYLYSNPQRVVVQSHRLLPTESNSQQVVNWSVDCEGAKFGHVFTDAAGDRLRTMTVNHPQDEVVIHISGEVETKDTNGVVKVRHDKLSPLVYLRSTPTTKADAEIRKFSQSLAEKTSSGGLELAHELCGAVNSVIEYEPESTHQKSTSADAFKQKRGVCQDQTHVLLTLAREQRIPARYVAGYLLTDAEGLSHDASHAWAELFIEDLGWVGFDPTNACCPDDRYIRIGSGLDAQEAALIRGVTRGSGSEEMQTQVKVSSQQQ